MSNPIVDITALIERTKGVPDKASVFYYSSGSDIVIVAEYREGTQPMRRPLLILKGALGMGGWCE